MKVLGINCYLHESSAALISDGRVVFAAEEERFSRIKKDHGFPKLAIGAALSHASIGFDDIDAVAFGWNPGGAAPLHNLRASVTGRLPFSPSAALHSIHAIAAERYSGNGLRALQGLYGPVAPRPVFNVDHHEAHAWSTYALSGFGEALVLVMDGRGATQSTSMYHAKGAELVPVRTIEFPNSLGAFYEGFTDLLGFERHNDEWKVMGLAAYGTPTYDLDDVLHQLPDGYRLNNKYFGNGYRDSIARLEERFGPRRSPEIHIDDADRDLAASVQWSLEQAVFALVADGVRRTGVRNLCLAGGVAMNSKANGKVLASGLIDDLFVQPAATDDGTAIGAAIAAHRALATLPQYRLNDVYLGPEYGDEQIGAALRSYKLTSTYAPNVEAVVAKLLAQGKIVGWFQGRMEFGPRALGNRSILADARDERMKDRVNESVKFREGWRPFAPSCLAEAADEYFVGCKDAPFMITTFDVRPEKRGVIPAVTHADNTARVQTVSRAANPRYWTLIREFAALTGVPVVMNTSFNLRGEPIVCTPRDAIRTFYSSGLDALALGNFVITKDASLELDVDSVGKVAVGAAR